MHLTDKIYYCSHTNSAATYSESEPALQPPHNQNNHHKISMHSLVLNHAKAQKLTLYN